MEMAKFGQLRNYLQTHRDLIELAILVSYCNQLSSAMDYLESKKYVHRDIAARNVLVVHHECVKLSDFGLSREVDDNVYLVASKCKLPIKWMAPESINFRKFTSRSDVWMFGVCMWEVFSYGARPYQNVRNVDVVRLIEERRVLDRPVGCPLEVFAVMLECWEYEPSRRPTFAQLMLKLK
jgi:focal adhesion kinase 1